MSLWIFPKEESTGVSGSGKSGIVFDTIAAESQRQMNETHTAFMRGRLPRPYSKQSRPAQAGESAVTPAPALQGLTTPPHNRIIII